ncbi:Uncharacterised protein [Mycobacteroides abscessus subsp. abscessus]|nr:Uncharacterised protein [Mycobacteroides abscessus subsp. abscessus]SPX81782.1 Uncharacterised protein [Mycobacteroides abscessus]
MLGHPGGLERLGQIVDGVAVAREFDEQQPGIVDGAWYAQPGIHELQRGNAVQIPEDTAGLDKSIQAVEPGEGGDAVCGHRV